MISDTPSLLVAWCFFVYCSKIDLFSPLLNLLKRFVVAIHGHRKNPEVRSLCLMRWQCILCRYERRWKADSIIAAPDLTELPTRAAILDKGVTVFGGTEPRKTSNSEDDKVESTLRTIATDIAIQTSEEEVARVFLGEDIVDLPTGEVSTTSKAEEWINGYPRLDLV